jgi:hypothetical protein
MSHPPQKAGDKVLEKAVAAATIILILAAFGYLIRATYRAIHRLLSRHKKAPP